MTELVWAGKPRAGEPAAAEPPAPRQTVEIVERADAPPPLLGGWRNRLVFGDARAVLPSLGAELGGAVDLVYVDPPFSTGADFAAKARLPAGPAAEAAAEARISRPAFRDRWGPGLDGYLQWFYETVIALRRLLAPHGSLYVHLDWHVGHYAKAVLDEVLGAENFLGEIIWSYGSPSGGRVAGAKLVKAHDVIFGYARERGRHKYRVVYLPYRDKYVADWFRFTDEAGRRYRKRMRGKNPDGTPRWEIQYLDESKGQPASSVWSDIQQVYADPRAYKENTTSEILGYPTQKPERLVERILRMASDEGDLVLDAFVGSGTTVAVAERLGRRWIGCDSGPLALETTRKRLLGAGAVRPFVIERVLETPAAERAAPQPDAGIALGQLELGLRVDGRRVTLELRGVSPPEAPDADPGAPAPAPAEGCASFVDSWSVDWEHEGGVFRNGWHAQRTPRRPRLALAAEHVYARPGRREIAVRCVDLFGHEIRAIRPVDIA